MTVEEYRILIGKQKGKKVGTDKQKQRRDDSVGILIEQIIRSGLPSPTREYRFHPVRRWRFDLCWPDKGLVALEVEGGIWNNGRHTRGLGFLKDMEKYNAATMMGWRVFRVTPQQIKEGVALGMLRNIFSVKSKNNYYTDTGIEG